MPSQALKVYLFTLFVHFKNKKDLANIVSYQQDQIDEVETHMEKANKNAESGLKQIEKAQAKQDQNCIIS